MSTNPEDVAWDAYSQTETRESDPEKIISETYYDDAKPEQVIKTARELVESKGDDAGPKDLERALNQKGLTYRPGEYHAEPTAWGYIPGFADETQVQTAPEGEMQEDVQDYLQRVYVRERPGRLTEESINKLMREPHFVRLSEENKKEFLRRNWPEWQDKSEEEKRGILDEQLDTVKDAPVEEPWDSWLPWPFESAPDTPEQRDESRQQYLRERYLEKPQGEDKTTLEPAGVQNVLSDRHFIQLSRDNQKKFLRNHWDKFSELEEKNPDAAESILDAVEGRHKEEMYKYALGREQGKTYLESGRKPPEIEEGRTPFTAAPIALGRGIMQTGSQSLGAVSQAAANAIFPGTIRKGPLSREEVNAAIEDMGMGRRGRQRLPDRPLEEELTDPTWWANFLGENAIPTIAAYASSAAGYPAAGMGVIGTVEFGQQYREAMDQGASSEEALAEGLGYSTIATALEMAPAQRLFGEASEQTIKAAKQAAKNRGLSILKQTGAQALEESTQELAQEMSSTAARTIGGGEGKRPEAQEKLERWLKAALSGGVMGGAIGGVTQAVRGSRAQSALEDHNRVLDRTAEKTANKIEELAERGDVEQQQVDRVRNLIDENVHRNNWEQFRSEVERIVEPVIPEMKLADDLRSLEQVVERSVRTPQQDLLSIVRGPGYQGPRAQILDVLHEPPSLRN